MISHHAALIYTMVLTAAADREMTDREIRRIRNIIGDLPVFADYPMDLLPKAVGACAELLQDENGLEQAFVLIKAGLPKRLRETAYALACDVAAADGAVGQEEMRLLEMVRHRLDIDRLIAAGIERGARARFTVHKREDKEET
jgi:tellurite resistance protein